MAFMFSDQGKCILEHSVLGHSYKHYHKRFLKIQKKIQMLFFWTFYLTKNSENVSWLSHKYETAVFNIDNNQHIRMISERSCDTEDWIQHCITGINYILQYIQIEHRF